jgi:hypothetical protein
MKESETENPLLYTILVKEYGNLQGLAQRTLFRYNNRFSREAAEEFLQGLSKGGGWIVCVFFISNSTPIGVVFFFYHPPGFTLIFTHKSIPFR